MTLRFTEQNEPLQYSKIAHGPGSRGFFWETHMEFLGLFAVTKMRGTVADGVAHLKLVWSLKVQWLIWPFWTTIVVIPIWGVKRAVIFWMECVYLLGIRPRTSILHHTSFFLTCAAQAGFSSVLGPDRRFGCPAEIFTILHGLFGWLNEVVMFFLCLQLQAEKWNEWSPLTWGPLNSPGYLDGYTDATAVFIAASCDDPLAQTLANAMGIAYLRPGSTEGVGDLSCNRGAPRRGNRDRLTLSSLGERLGLWSKLSH